jgi:hypothetical protein
MAKPGDGRPRPALLLLGPTVVTDAVSDLVLLGRIFVMDMTGNGVFFGFAHTGVVRVWPARTSSRSPRSGLAPSSADRRPPAANPHAATRRGSSAAQFGPSPWPRGCLNGRPQRAVRLTAPDLTARCAPDRHQALRRHHTPRACLGAASRRC